jgi:hypothetical protein
MTVISGFLAYGCFLPNPVFYGPLVIGYIAEATIVFIVGTGDLMWDFMEA